jgi:hypothetical protein
MNIVKRMATRKHLFSTNVTLPLVPQKPLIKRFFVKPLALALYSKCRHDICERSKIMTIVGATLAM